ncbi:MAG: MFS transporter [Chloroflexi bacterium]|nr:MFS transporter [Chloroflexota bacterium]
MAEQTAPPRARPFDLFAVNAYWPGLSFMWNSLHLLILPAVLLGFVDNARKNTALGMLTFVGLIIALLVQPLSGALSDAWPSRYGRRRPLLILGTLADLIFLYLIATASNLGTLAVGYIGLQFTSNIAHGPAQGLMHDRVPLSQMGVASGVKNFLDMAGMVISALVVGRMITSENPNPVPAISVVAALMVVGLLVTVFGVREAASNSRGVDFKAGVRQVFHIDLRANTNYWRLVWSRFLFLFGVYGIQAFAQYFVSDKLQPENAVKLTGDLMAAIVLSLLAFSILAGYLADRVGRKPLHVVAAILVAIGSLLMMTAATPTAVLVFGSIVGAGIGLFITANWALANDLAPAGEAGKFLGLTNLATAGASAASRLAGPGIDALNAWRPGAFLGYAALFSVGAALALLSLIALRRVPDRKHAPAAQPAA